MHTPHLTPLSRLLCAAGLLTIGLPAPAQEAGPKGGIIEVIVTAQKIAQPAIKTPLALTVLGGEDMKNAGINEARALADSVPNVQITQEAGKLQIAIRGVASLDMTEKGDPSAAFNVDGAYISRPEAQSGAFFDVDRVEVLRGPQGTLYGRNATAGAINVITNRPTGTLGGKLNVELGNYNTRRLEGVVNVPINQVFSLRAAVNVNQHDTYYNPGPNTDVDLETQNDRAGRLHLLGKFTRDTGLLLTAESSRAGGTGPGPIPMRNFFDGTPIDRLPFSPPGSGNNIDNPVYVDRGAATQLTENDRFRPGAVPRNIRANSLRGEFKTTLGAIDLTYQLARLKTDTIQTQNGTYFGFPLVASYDGDSSATSHELRFNGGKGGALRWVAGLYAFDESLHRDSVFRTYITAPFGSFVTVVPYDSTVNNKSRAAFGQMTWSVRGDTRLIAGLRRTVDDKAGRDPLGGVPIPAGATVSPGAYDLAVKFSNTSWKLGVDHDLNRSVMLYASLSTGYKAGGYNDNRISAPYRPENLKSFEAGVKGRFLDNTLQVTANYFHYDYSDLQLSSIVCLNADTTSCGTRTTNAANASIDGAEVEGKMKLGENGTLRAALSLTKARFDQYRPNATDDFSGQQLDRAPKRVVNLGYTQRFPLPNGAELIATAATRMSSSYLISDTASGVRYEQPSFHKADLSLMYAPLDSKYTVQLFAKNLENRITLESRLPSAFYVSDPRTFGLRATATF